MEFLDWYYKLLTAAIIHSIQQLELCRDIYDEEDDS
jgi:hypothetical protein